MRLTIQVALLPLTVWAMLTSVLLRLIIVVLTPLIKEVTALRLTDSENKLLVMIHPKTFPKQSESCPHSERPTE